MVNTLSQVLMMIGKTFRFGIYLSQIQRYVSFQNAAFYSSTVLVSLAMI